MQNGSPGCAADAVPALHVGCQARSHPAGQALVQAHGRVPAVEGDARGPAGLAEVAAAADCAAETLESEELRLPAECTNTALLAVHSVASSLAWQADLWQPVVVPELQMVAEPAVRLSAGTLAEHAEWRLPDVRSEAQDSAEHAVASLLAVQCPTTTLSVQAA